MGAARGRVPRNVDCRGIVDLRQRETRRVAAPGVLAARDDAESH